MSNKKTRVAMLSIMSNTGLIIIKLIVGILSGSISVISEAIHSGMDLIASIIAYLSVRVSDLPPDEEHPYGHGKIENVSGVIEAVLILVASVFIIVEATKKLLSDEPIGAIGVGCIAMFISAVVNMIVSRKLYKVAKEEDSIALAADALHLKADVYTSLGVGVGLLVLWITKLNFLDPVIAIVIAILILFEALKMLNTAYSPLLDAKLSDEEIDIIKGIVLKHKSSFINFHDLRSRRAGKFKHIDLHLTVPHNLTIQQSHDICEEIEGDINQNMQNTVVLIHVEPCLKTCDTCSTDQGTNCKNK